MLFYIFYCNLLVIKFCTCCSLTLDMTRFQFMHLPSAWDMTSRRDPLGRVGPKVCWNWKTWLCWSAMLSEEDLGQKGESDKIESSQEGLWEELSQLCHHESPTERTLYLQQSFMVVIALPLIFLVSSIKYFLYLCAHGLSCLCVPHCNPFFFLKKSVRWQNT